MDAEEFVYDTHTQAENFISDSDVKTIQQLS